MIYSDDFDDILGDLVSYADDTDMAAALNRFNVSVNKRNISSNNLAALASDNTIYQLGIIDGSAGIYHRSDEGDNQRKKRRLLKKAPEAPRRFKSAYIIFVMDKMEEVKKSSPVDNKITDIMKKLASMWHDLCPEERAIFEARANSDKERYFEEMKVYTGPTHVPNKRRRKAPGAPKRAMSAFLAFSQQMRPRVRASHPNLKNTDISSLLAQNWRESSDEIKRPFIDREIIEREQYHDTMNKWREEESSALLQEGNNAATASSLVYESLLDSKSKSVSKNAFDPSFDSIDTTTTQKKVKCKAVKKSIDQNATTSEIKKRKYTKKNTTNDNIFDNFDNKIFEINRMKDSSESIGINAYSRYGALDGGDAYSSITTEAWSSINEEFWNDNTGKPAPADVRKKGSKAAVLSTYRGALKTHQGLHQNATAVNSSSSSQQNLHGRLSDISRSSVLESMCKKAAETSDPNTNQPPTFFGPGDVPFPAGVPEHALSGVKGDSHLYSWPFDHLSSLSKASLVLPLDATRNQAAQYNGKSSMQRSVTDTLRAVHMASLQKRAENSVATAAEENDVNVEPPAVQEKSQQSMTELANAYYFPRTSFQSKTYATSPHEG